MNNQSEKIQNDFETSTVENNEVEINQVENNEAEEKNRAFKLFLLSISETDYLQYNGKKIKFGGVVHKRAILELNLPLPLGWEFTVVPRRIPKPRKPVKPRIKREPKIKAEKKPVNTVDIENTVNIENIEKLVEAKRKSIIQKYETKKMIPIYDDSDAEEETRSCASLCEPVITPQKKNQNTDKNIIDGNNNDKDDDIIDFVASKFGEEDAEELKERMDTRRSLCEPQIPIFNSTNLKVGFASGSCIPVRNTQIGSLRQVGSGGTLKGGQKEDIQIDVIEYTSQIENVDAHNSNVGNWLSCQEIYEIDGYTEQINAVIETPIVEIINETRRSLCEPVVINIDNQITDVHIDVPSVREAPSVPMVSKGNDQRRFAEAASVRPDIIFPAVTKKQRYIPTPKQHSNISTPKPTRPTKKDEILKMKQLQQEKEFERLKALAEKSETIIEVSDSETDEEESEIEVSESETEVSESETDEEANPLYEKFNDFFNRRMKDIKDILNDDKTTQNELDEYLESLTQRLTTMHKKYEDNNDFRNDEGLLKHFLDHYSKLYRYYLDYYPYDDHAFDLMVIEGYEEDAKDIKDEFDL